MVTYYVLIEYLFKSIFKKSSLSGTKDLKTKSTLYLDITRTSLAIRDNCLDITSKYLVVTKKNNYLVITTIDMVIVRKFLKNTRFNSSFKKKLGLKK